MMKYPISREFFPYNHFTPPIQNPGMAGWMGSMMKPPRRIFRDSQVEVTAYTIPGYREEPVEVLVIRPRENQEVLPCLVYAHGGGFFFGGAGYHYRLAKEYALKTPCTVVFVQYRLAPKHPHPTPSEDSYSALLWTHRNAEKLNIDRTKIAVGGDSAGGALAAAVCQMARDRGTDLPVFQLLVYPVTDRRMKTQSNRNYTDTPMWNSRLSVKMWQGYLPDETVGNIAYASPMEAESFTGLPDAYVETAEFDCLHDEGIAYADALRNGGARVTVNETAGTMHGFDIAEKAPVTKSAVDARIRYMQSKFSK